MPAERPSGPVSPYAARKDHPFGAESGRLNPPPSAARRKAAALASAFALAAALALLGGCAVLQGLKDRLGVLNMRFSLDRVDVSRLAYPSSILSAAAGAFFPDRSLLGQFGVDIVCGIRAVNSNPARAVFDGAVGRLRVQDVSPSARSAQGQIPAFTVGPNSDTVINVTFPLRLDNPVFAKAAWKAIVAGQDVPYRVDADMRFRLPGASALGLPDTVRTVTLNVDKGSVNAKASGNLVERILAVIDKVL
jgi:hypothetical protein